VSFDNPLISPDDRTAGWLTMYPDPTITGYAASLAFTFIRSDLRHSKREKRYYALGQTSTGRRLFIVFTVRRKLIRVISARDMNRNETEKYARYEEETS
jgi:uncharacterized DUF497 family protein